MQLTYGTSAINGLHTDTKGAIERKEGREETADSFTLILLMTMTTKTSGHTHAHAHNTIAYTIDRIPTTNCKIFFFVAIKGKYFSFWPQALNNLLLKTISFVVRVCICIRNFKMDYSSNLMAFIELLSVLIKENLINVNTLKEISLIECVRNRLKTNYTVRQ